MALKKAASVGEGVLDYISSLWHGSPKTFPPTERNPLGEFDMSKMGTGEGVQMQGWGTYLASEPDLSRGYRDMAAQAGQAARQASDEAMAPYLDMYQKIINNPRATPEDYEKASVLEQLLIDGDLQGVASRGKDSYGEAGWKFFTEEIQPNFKREGSLYQVDLKATDKDIMNWDAPLSQQNPEVVKKLFAPMMETDAWKSYINQLPEDAQKLATEMLMGSKPKTVENFDILNAANKNADHNILYDLPSDFGIQKRDSRFNVFEAGESSGVEPTGAEIYRNLADMAGKGKDDGGIPILDEIRSGASSDEEAASRFLDMLGIKGLRVTDSAPDKPNYVIFSPENMNIAKKFGMAGTGGLLTYLGGPTGPSKSQASTLPGGFTRPSARAVSEGLDRSRQSRSASTALSVLEALDPAFLMPQPTGGGVDTMEGYLRSQTR